MATPSIPSPQSQLRSAGSPWKTIAVVLPFLVLFWINIAHHVPFFDEVNAWAISAASPDLKTLFHYVHFEGHPWLWYFILWFPSRLTHDPVGMKWVEAALGTAILLIIGLLSPFTYKQRLLILSSYFLLWEYTVMCRMYSVMLLLVLLYVVRRVRRPEGVLGNCVLLGLAGNTDMTGVLLSSALLVEYAYSSYFGVPKEERGVVLQRWLRGLLVYVALVGVSVASLWPAKDISWQSSGPIGAQALDPRRIRHIIGELTGGPWWPISPYFPHKFWETTAMEAHWLYPVGVFALALYWMIFRRQRNLLLLMGTTLLFAFVFADVVYEGHVRHWGIMFVSFVVGLWLQSSDKRDRCNGLAVWSPWAYGLLGLSAVAGLFALIGSWNHPFSRARDAATWVVQNQPSNVLMTGTPDVSLASLAEEMQRPVFFLECECADTFKLFSKEHENVPETETPGRLKRALDILGRNEILFSSYQPIDEDLQRGLHNAGLRFELLKAFPGADMLTESFYLYRISKRPSGAALQPTGM